MVISVQVIILISLGIFWLIVTFDVFFFSIFRLGLQKKIDWLPLHPYQLRSYNISRNTQSIHLKLCVILFL